MTEIDGSLYLDQLLIEEFHEAGIWLPEEIEARERQREMDERQAKFFASQMQMQAQANMTTIPTMISGQFGSQGLGLLGQQQSALGGGLAPLLGSLFGGFR